MAIPELTFHGVVAWHPTGSNYICDPPVTNTDIDYLVWVLNENVYQDYLKQTGWQFCGDEAYTGPAMQPFFAYRKEQYNIILTEDRSFYYRFAAATELAKKRNLLEKQDRIDLFKVVIGS